ncbi:transposase family protein [Streptosporangium sp. NPDC023963]|uniref:transposase family protein n=1 Tax=Streptosporangium sp. NPDC023963 TaxID=3155608 RepID=UPI00342EBD8C
MITYRATLDVSRDLVRHVATLLAAERRRRGTRADTRALTCFGQAVLVLRWFRDRTDPTALARDHHISRATAYRYLDEAIEILADQAPDLHQCLRHAQAQELPHLILDGTVIATDRCREKTTSVKGEPIDLWYSGKAHHHGGNLQALFALDGMPLWVSDVEPGSVHDLVAARTRNMLLRALRCLGERGFALLTQRWRTLQHITASPSKIGDIARAALVLTHFEHGRLI